MEFSDFSKFSEFSNVWFNRKLCGFKQISHRWLIFCLLREITTSLAYVKRVTEVMFHSLIFVICNCHLN